jgi:hypothetical protein
VVNSDACPLPRQDGAHKKVLILAPVSVVHQWEREMGVWVGLGRIVTLYCHSSALYHIR